VYTGRNGKASVFSEDGGDCIDIRIHEDAAERPATGSLSVESVMVHGHCHCHWLVGVGGLVGFWFMLVDEK